ncbi:MAG: DNA helicase RecQ [Paludibacteraceae bacterium]|nr:DNA helicase RecQ [Paludibacteraceae bacterium]
MATKSVIVKALKKYFGFDTFKGNQEEIVKCVLAGNDTFVLMPTGGGKSLCFQLPAVIMDGTAIVVSPLISLMKNQVDMMRRSADDDHIAHFLNSSLTRAEVEMVKDDLKTQKTKILYVAPESLGRDDNIEFLKTITISFFAIDEAHCISEWGHDFRPEYRRLREIINSIGSRPVVALTATATPKVQHDIQKTLQMNNVKVFKSSFNRPNLYYEVRPKNDNIDKEIIKYIKTQPGKSGIVYCLSRKKVEELAELLRANGIRAEAYHAGLDSETRSKTQDNFLMEEIDVIVATIAFGMGIDKPDVRYVIHYDIPKSLEGYYQETGRAGRDGGEGQCIAFYSRKDLAKLEKFMDGKPDSEKEIGRQLLNETAAYAESSMCRRRQLMNYFGEQYLEDNCGNCDNCLNPKEQIDASDLLESVLELIVDTKEKFKTDVIIDVLRGRESADVTDYGLVDHELFGTVGNDEDTLLPAVIREAIVRGYITRSVENYGVLKITAAGNKFLEDGGEFKVSKDHSYEDDVEVIPQMSGASCAVDPALFSMLKDLRKCIAKEVGLAPYTIFQDPSLESMATTYPITLEELATVPGVSAGKVQRYGEQFIDLIKRHVETNEIERPEDIRIKSAGNRSRNRIDLIQAIDRKVAIDDIAEHRCLSVSEIIDEMESIVSSGIKLDINYFLYDVYDPQDIDDIFNYFKDEAETDDWRKALEELGEDEFDEDQVRLTRIKFISEVCN